MPRTLECWNVRALGMGMMSALALSSGMANAQSPGWYAGFEGFGTQVQDIEGTQTTIVPDFSIANSCLIALDLLGVPVLTDDLCVIGNNAALTPGSSSTVPATIEVKNGFGGGLTFGYLFDGGLRPELNIRYAEADLDVITIDGASSQANDASLRTLRLMANLWFDVELGNWAPYFGGGAGIQNTELSRGPDELDDDTAAFQLGAGLAYWFGNATAVSLDYRFVTAEDPSFEQVDPSGIRTTTEGRYRAHNLGLGFRYSFGGQFSDADGDGVFDRKDECPDTPAGVSVYPNGCPLDLDQDGIADYLDKCPDTPRGAPVDAQGCPYDSDGDGVADHLDQCPGTPAGSKVDAKGCPFDSDGDGVPDDRDQCPGTPPGAAVNAQGCAIADTDGDGIPDHLDKCPASDPSIKVGPDGCALDSDGDGIPDHLDECPNTPAGLAILPDGCALVGDCRRPRPGEPVDANGCALDSRFVLKGVKFEYDSDRLTAAAKRVLDAVAETIAAYPGLNIEVQGHTDSLGSDGYNLGLSERRSNAVKRYLVSRGVSGESLRPVGYGETAPIADNNTKQGQEDNRRVEFRVIQ